MPYGVDKKLGGDSPENVKWMENCVKRVMSTGKDKGTAIAICKTAMRKKMSKADLALVGIEQWLVDELPDETPEDTTT